MRSKQLHTILILAATTVLSLAAGDGIFPKYICDIRCDVNRTIEHSFCAVTKPCSGFRNYDMQKRRFKNIKTVLVIAHNGLRNRLAEKIKATGVLYMKWDNDLSEMASKFQRRCLTYKKDACANFKTDTVSMERMASEFTVSNFRHVVQNSYYVKTSAAQFNFVEMGLRQWYLEHNQLAPPSEFEVKNETYTKIIGENNFTHIVAPHTRKFGCSTSKFHGGFSLVCYYYPYHRTEEAALLYKMRTPESQCPNQFPIQHETFPQLCSTVDVSRASTHARQRWLLYGDIDVGGRAFVLSLVVVLSQFGFVGWRSHC